MEKQSEKVESLLFCMRDKVAERCGPVFECVNTQVAIRSARNMKVQNVEDFDLLLIGEKYADGNINGGRTQIIEWKPPQTAAPDVFGKAEK